MRLSLADVTLDGDPLRSEFRLEAWAAAATRWRHTFRPQVDAGEHRPTAAPVDNPGVGDTGPSAEAAIGQGDELVLVVIGLH